MQQTIFCIFLSPLAKLLGRIVPFLTISPSFPSRRASRTFTRVCVLQLVDHYNLNSKNSNTC